MTAASSDDAPVDPITPLIAEARAGSAAAIGSLLEAARAYLLMQADTNLPASLRAKLGPSDIVQETAINAHRNFASFRGNTRAELYAWLRTILENNVVDAVRRFEMTHKRDTNREERLSVVVDRAGLLPLGVDGTTPERSAIRREDAAIVREVLAGMPADHATVLRLRYWEGLTFPEIAVRIGRSEDAARKLWYRALARLDAGLRPSATGSPEKAQPHGE